MNKVLKLDEERIDFLIGLLISFAKSTTDRNNLLIAKEIYTDLSILGLEE